MRVMFVVNPAAGRGCGARVWGAVRARFPGPLEAVFSASPGHAARLARAAAADGYDRVVALGGDGTVFEVANGLVGMAAELAVVPGGTGNDFCRTAAIPTDPLAAARLAFSGRARPIDVARLGGGAVHFVNVAGIGFDAEVARAANRYPKYLGGTAPYLLALLRTLFRYRPTPMEIEVDGRRFGRKVFMLAIGNGRYYGGGMCITPTAVDDDGLLDICIAGDLGKAEVLSLLPRIYSGGHVGHPKVEILRACQVTVRADTPVAVHADGESIGGLPVTVAVQPRLLSVVSQRD